MKGFLPKNLVGQMAVLIGIALLLAQLASFAFLLAQRQQFNRAQIDTPAITRFTSAAADFASAAPDFKALVLGDASRRGAHYEIGRQSAVTDDLSRRGDTEDRLRQSLQSAGIQFHDVRASIEPRAQERRRDGARRRPAQTMLLSMQLGGWRMAQCAAERAGPAAAAHA